MSTALSFFFFFSIPIIISLAVASSEAGRRRENTAWCAKLFDSAKNKCKANDSAV